MIEYGKRVVGLTRLLPERYMLKEGQLYEIRAQASSGIVDPESVATYIMSKLNEQYPQMRVTWLKVCAEEQTINFQFITVPAETLGFAPVAMDIVTIIAWLPLVLAVIGIAIVAISGWAVLAGIPWYIWALLGTGVILFIFGPSLAKLITGVSPEKYRKEYRKRYY